MREEEFNSLSRKDKTNLITKAIMKRILIEGRGSRITIREVNVDLEKYASSKRIDVLEIKRNNDTLIGYEVKSCIQDFRKDKKWENYLDFVHQLFFVFDYKTYEKYKEEIELTICGKAGVYLYSAYNNCACFHVEVQRRKIEINPEIYKRTLFNFLLRNQIKELNGKEKEYEE